MIQSSKISESAEYRQREADFKRDQRKQAAQLNSSEEHQDC